MVVVDEFYLYKIIPIYEGFYGIRGDGKIYEYKKVIEIPFEPIEEEVKEDVINFMDEDEPPQEE